jgi:peptidyl-prolyl cis-trans isomerase D
VAYAVSSPFHIVRKFIDDNSTANVNYIFVGLNTINDSVTVTDEEIKNYYDKNKEYYKVKNQRKVKTLTFHITPSAEDSARANKRIERIREELVSVNTVEQRDSIFSIKLNEYTGTETEWQLLQDVNPQVISILGNASKGEVLGPIQSYDATYFYRLDGRRSGEQEVVKASHILISFNNNKDSARAYTAKLMREINNGNFAEYAKKYSEDKGSGSQGGDLGYFGKGRMVPEFEKAAFGAKVGSIVGPIETQFGYHIIKVVDKKSEEIKYSFISFKPTVSVATKNKIKRDAFAAMKQIEEGMDIDTLASKLGVPCSESPLLSRERPYQGSMFLTNKIFNAKLGDVIEPREVANGNYVVVLQVSHIRKAGIASLEDVSDQIKSKLIRIKKLDLAKLKAGQIYNVVKKHTSLNEVVELPEGVRIETAEVRNNGVIAGVPTDFAATSHIFNLPTNKINSPVRGEQGYFIFEIKSREIPTADRAKDAEDVSKAHYARGLFDTWFNKFKEDSKIIDHRSKFYAEY